MLKHLVVLLVFMASIQGAALEDIPAYIKSAIEKTIESVDSTAQVGVEVVGLDGSYLYKRNEDKRYVPGSSLKLFVAAAALDILGADYRFETRIVSDGRVSDGVLDGNCFLIASGDPSLDVQGLEDLVLKMKLKGVNRIIGDLVLDLSVFDDVELGPGWMWDEAAAFWCSPLGALNVEHNCVAFHVKPGEKVGRRCNVSFYPECEGVHIVNRSETLLSGGSAEMRRLVDGRFELVGALGVDDKSLCIKLPVRVPHLFAADVLMGLFAKHQIAFEGNVVVGSCPKIVTKLGAHRSEPLKEILKVVLKNSDNLYADALFKKVGQTRFGYPGTWLNGSKAVREFLSQKVGLDVSEMVVLDGCGVSRYNLVSPNQMVSFLTWVHGKFAYGEELKAALSISGVDGAMKKRMKAPFLMSKVRAKSGTMTGVSSLCGYLTGKKRGGGVCYFRERLCQVWS